MSDSGLSEGQLVEQIANVHAREAQSEYTSYDLIDGKKLQEGLKQLYRSIMENTHVAIALIDLNYKIHIANRTIGEKFNKPINQLVGNECFREFEKRQAICPHCPGKVAIETGQPAEAESEGISGDGTSFPVRIQAFPAFDASGAMTGFVEIVEDITERKRAEQALSASELQYRTTLNSMRDAIHVVDTDLKIVLINDSFRRWAKDLGLKIHRPIGRKINDVFPFLTDKICDEYYQVLSNGKVLTTEEVNQIAGKHIITETRKIPIFESDQVVRVVTIIRDITERRLADRQIRERAKIIDSTTDSVIKTNRDSIVTMWNRGAERIFGYSSEEMIGQPIEILYSEQERHRLAEIIETLLRGEEITTTEVTCVHKNGKPVELALSVLPLKDENGNVVDFVGISKDISDRKKAQKALHDSENRYRSVIENAGEGIVVVQDGKLRFVNSRLTFVTGHSQEESMSRPFIEFVHPEDRKRVAEVHAARLRGEQVPSVYEFRIIDNNGQTRWLENNGVLIEWNGKPASLNFLRDITARKKAEEALREREEMIRALVETSRDWIWSIDLNGVHTYCNPAIEQILGYSPDELVGKRSLDLIHDDDRMRVETNLPTWIDEKRGWSNLMLRWRHKDGTYRYLESNAVPILNLENELVGFRGVDRDITDRNRAEEALKESEEKFRSLAEQSPNMIFINRKGRIIYANKKCEEVMGYKREEFYSPDFDFLSLIAPESVDSIKDNFTRHLRGEEVQPYDYSLINKQGKRIDAINASKLVHYEGETAILGIVTDITERKQAEKKLLEDREQLKSLASQLSLTEEHERREIATELHDRIGQSLVISKIKLDQLRKTTSSDELTQTLGEICDCLDQVIQDTRTLTFDLSYPILYELGFEAAVAEWLNEQIQEKYRIKTEFEDDHQPKPLDDDIRVLLFRNVRELLINVVKHSNARNVKVSVSKADNRIIVCVEDDGIGFDPSETASKAIEKATFGLFSIRERLEHLEGHLEIKSKPGSGSRITMTAPLKRENIDDEAQI